jgi:hypothetical protein
MASLDSSGVAICLVKVIFAWFVLGFVGANLIGLVVRGLLWSPPVLDAPTDRARELLHRENRRMTFANMAMTVLSIILTGAYVFALFHFWNINLALAGGILMAARIPDLVWEIRTGDRVTRANRPKGTVYTIATICMWGSLLLIGYSLYE